MSNLELFLGIAPALAEGRGLPTAASDYKYSRQLGAGVRTIVLDTMLAQVAVLPQQTDQVTLVVYGGDDEMIGRLVPVVTNGVLTLKGDLPYKPGSASQNMRGGNVFIGGNVTISGGSFSSVDNNVLIINGREVDLERAMQLVLMVPQGINLKVRGLVGAVGVGPGLGGEIDFSASLNTRLFANDATSLTGDVAGSGSAEVLLVDGDVDVEISGSGRFNIGQATGKIEAKISGSGRVTIAGGRSRSLRASVSGSGKITHQGSLVGDARLRVSGSGKIEVGTVGGELDHNISGSGKITANGQTYKSRW
ncbi:MAG: hypothetical protein JWN38_1150 [Candidatus Saccharibacteria bacterium]|nr:hypothetical protein [Candidatus Saccharibacteria bacterium]